MAKAITLAAAAGRGTLLFLARCIGSLDVLGVSHNVAAVVPGVVYRSGTIPLKRLDRLISDQGIRTVVNLRGGTGRDWHSQQHALLSKRGVAFRELKLSSQSMPSLAKMQALAAILADSPTPILIHCRSGADRTGLAAAIYHLAIRGRPLDEARAALSFRYGHFPWLWSRTKAMGRALELFAAYHEAQTAGDQVGADGGKAAGASPQPMSA